MRIKEWLGDIYDGILDSAGIGHLLVRDTQTDYTSLIHIHCWRCKATIYETQVKGEISSSFSYSQGRQGCQHTKLFLERLNSANKTIDEMI